MRSAWLLLTSLIFVLPTAARAWELREDAASGARAAYVTATGTGPAGPATATLVIHHRRGAPLKVVKTANATEAPVVVELCVDHFESVKGFDFLAFEGPDAPAAAMRLVSVTIEAGKGHFAKTFRPGGWINRFAWLLPGPRPPENESPAKAQDDFTFGIGDAVRDADDLVALAKMLQASPTRLEVSVADSKDPKKVLRFSFATGDVGDVLGKLMR